MSKPAKNNQEQILSCITCGSQLLKIVTLKTNEEMGLTGKTARKSKFQVTKCFRCGGKSKISDIFEGATAITPMNTRTRLEQAQTTTEDSVVLSTIDTYLR